MQLTSLISTPILSALLTGTLLAIPAWAADDDKDNPKVVDGEETAKSGVTVATEQAALAAQLLLQGEKQKSPILLLAAAEILGDLKEGKSLSEPKAKEEKDDDVEAGEGSAQKEKAGTPALNVREIVDRARELAKGDAELSGLIEKRMGQLSSRGLVFSQGVGRSSVRLRGTTFKVLKEGYIRPGYTYTLSGVKMEGRKPAMIATIGDGDGDLDLWVYDGNSGRLIGKDTDYDSTPVVTWTPRYTGPFRVRVKNVGRITEKYYILVNW